MNASNNRRKRACIIFRSFWGEPVELCYEPHIYGIQQIDSVDEETFLLFTSKTRQSLSTRSVWFLLFYGGSWKTSSWFLLYIGSAQLIRRRVKTDQLWICFSFWWNIFNNRLTAVRVDTCYSLSWCLYWESFTAFNFIYISNKTLGPPSVKWVILLWAPPILAAILCNAPPSGFSVPPPPDNYCTVPYTKHGPKHVNLVSLAAVFWGSVAWHPKNGWKGD